MPGTYIVIALTANSSTGCRVIPEESVYLAIYSKMFGPDSQQACNDYVKAHCQTGSGITLGGPEVPFPLTLTTGASTGLQDRLGKGVYKAFHIGGYVKVQASNINMSGLHPKAELVHVPTFVPPLRYELHVFETMPQLLNLIIGSAEAQYRAQAETDLSITIVDSEGEHEVRVEHP